MVMRRMAGACTPEPPKINLAEAMAVSAVSGLLLAVHLAFPRDQGMSTVKIFVKFFHLPWNVIDNKGPKMRKMGQMRLPRNVFENR